MITRKSSSRQNTTLVTDANNIRHDYYVAIKPQSTLNFDITVNASIENHGEAFWKVFGIARRGADPVTTELVDISKPEIFAASAFAMTYVEIDAEKMGGSLKISVVGIPNFTIKWNLSVQLKES